MPYTNVPEDLWDKMDSCVQQVQDQGNDKETAIAICHASIVKGNAFPDGITVDLSSFKSGARNNVSDRQRIRDIRTQAKSIIEHTQAMEPYDSDTTIVEETMGLQPKANITLHNIKTMASAGFIKAAGDMALSVLGVPFYGPNDGKDLDKEYFSPRTDTRKDIFTTIPVFYYHGMNPDGSRMDNPEQIGLAKYDHTDKEGHWYTVALNKASDLAKRIWEAAKKGLARASSGSIAHLVRKAEDGEILSWPVAELSLIDASGNRQPANAYAVAYPILKAAYVKSGLIMPELEPEPEQPQAHGIGAGDAQPSAASDGDGKKSTQNNNGDLEMDEKDLIALLDARDAQKAAEAKKAAEAAEIEALKKENEALKAKAAEANRLPVAPVIAKFSDEWAYDNLDAGDQAVLVGALESAKKTGRSAGASVNAFKALARKLEADKSRVGEVARQSMKQHAVKSDEVDYSTLASYGDEWVGIAYSQAIWDAIRLGTFVANKLPSVEVPNGVESMYLPLESTDPTWYKVAENTTYDSTMKVPVATVASSRLGTGRVLLSLGKMGARVLWTGEMEERSMIPFISQLRKQLSVSGAEALEYVIIDGDTAAASNINDIGGTTYSGAATSLFLLTNGFRKSPLVTTTANSRSAAGALSVDDYLATVKLMGTAGINAMDMAKVSFVVDPNTYWATMALPEIKTRESFASPTLENGRLTGLWGYEIQPSAQMHKNSATRKANTAGKVDQDTAGNNAYGAILAVRWDQWTLGYQRRMTMETTRFANSDTNEIVAMMSVGLIQRDTEASAITYYVGI